MKIPIPQRKQSDDGDHGQTAGHHQQPALPAGVIFLIHATSSSHAMAGPCSSPADCTMGISRDAVTTKSTPTAIRATYGSSSNKPPPPSGMTSGQIVRKRHHKRRAGPVQLFRCSSLTAAPCASSGEVPPVGLASTPLHADPAGQSPWISVIPIAQCCLDRDQEF